MIRPSVAHLISSLGLISTISFGQNIFSNNDALLVVGLETSAPMSGQSFTNSILNGLVVEKPLGQFSAVGSIHYSSAAKFYDYNMISQVSKRDSKLADVSYRYSRNEVRVGYMMLGAEVKYRLPCNCFFVFANVKQAGLVSKSEEQISSFRSTVTPVSNEAHQTNLMKGFGFGVNLPFSKYFRGVFKFGNEYSKSLLVSSQKQKNNKSFNISFGLQYGFK